MKKEILGDHVIYGDWDAEGAIQMLVHYHPNGLHCTVFLLGGFDYGGGIESYHEGLSSKAVDALVEEYEDNMYLLTEEIKKLKPFVFNPNLS